MEVLYAAGPAGVVGAAGREDLIELYRHPLPADRGAWVRSNFVMSLDGSVQGPDGRSGSINTVSDHEVFALHRALADAVLVGAQTVRTEGYRGVDLTDGQRDLRARSGLAPYPTLVVVSRSLDVGPEMVRPDGGPVLVLTGRADPARREPLRAAGVEVVELGGDGVDLSAAVGYLAAVGLGRVLCEGGPRLHRDLLAADLVDELSLTLAPVVVGGTGLRSTTGPALPAMPAFELSLVLRAEDQTLFLSYRRRR